MKPSFLIKTHFLGTKIKHLRKSNKMTLDDLALRCYQVDSQSAPSVSYLSLIENGQRNPSEKLLESICKIFHRSKDWFHDQNIVFSKDENVIENNFEHIQFEPNFLFSKDILENAIPALLSTTGTTGSSFAHILIRSYQEKHKNQFPYIEKEAEIIGKKRFPLSLDDILDLYKKNDLKIKWFEKESFITKDDYGQEIKSLFRSFYDEKGIVYINSKMKDEISRIKYDLCTYLGHKILHGGDGIVSNHATGGELGGSPRPNEKKSSSFDQKDILYAWRDFECSFFAGALLCPKIPFRKYLSKTQHKINEFKKIELTPAVIMRRITAVSSYKQWHYFDAYPPGYLRAIYRGNKMPMPWGNSRLVTDPCRQWGVFKHLSNLTIKRPLPQLSILKEKDSINMYCSISLKTNDAAGNPHIICTGISINDAIEMQGHNKHEVLNEIYESCYKDSGSRILTEEHKNIIYQIGTILNISWLIEAADNPVDIICQRSTNCPRLDNCENFPKSRKKISWTNQIKEEILKVK